jgi:hypothetical protein
LKVEKDVLDTRNIILLLFDTIMSIRDAKLVNLKTVKKPKNNLTNIEGLSSSILPNANKKNNTKAPTENTENTDKCYGKCK